MCCRLIGRLRTCGCGRWRRALLRWRTALSLLAASGSAGRQLRQVGPEPSLGRAHSGGERAERQGSQVWGRGLLGAILTRSCRCAGCQSMPGSPAEALTPAWAALPAARPSVAPCALRTTLWSLGRLASASQIVAGRLQLGVAPLSDHPRRSRALQRCPPAATAWQLAGASSAARRPGSSRPRSGSQAPPPFATPPSGSSSKQQQAP